MCYCEFLVLCLRDFVANGTLFMRSDVFWVIAILPDCGFRCFVFGSKEFLIFCVVVLLMCLLWVCAMMHVYGLVVAWFGNFGLVEL